MSITLIWSTPQDLLLLEEQPEERTQDIFSLKISHREGEIPVAQLLVPTSLVIPQNQYGYLYQYNQTTQERKLIFRGVPSGAPLAVNPFVQKIELLAISPDVETQHQELIAPLKSDIHPYFIDAHLPSELSDYLEGTPQLLCYHRTTHQVCLSDLFQGRETLSFKNQILDNSLSVQGGQSPLSAIQLHLTSEWVQEADGEINLMPLIETHFSQGMINTLTPSSLLQNWPQRGQMLGRSGYAVVRSHLRMVTPPQTGVLGIYPPVTPVIPSTNQRYPRYWLQGELKLSWTYRQKRREVLILTLNNPYLSRHDFISPQKTRPPRILHMPLQNIQDKLPHPSCSQFFETPEALPFLQHALDIARCHLAYSNRGLEIRLQIPFQDGLDLHLDQSIQVTHPCLPSETHSLTGKLVSYVLEKTAQKEVATLKIALQLSQEAHQEKWLAGNLSLTALDPLEGIETPHTLQDQDFISSLSLKNNAEEQIKSLQEEDLTPENLPATFSTQIQLELKDLRSQDVLTRRLTAEL